MSDPTNCPKCESADIYSDGNLWICPICAHEWSAHAAAAESKAEAEPDGLVRDANGTVLTDGDSVTVLKDLKVKGSSSAVKSGTKVRNIRIDDQGDGHNISCKVDGIGSIYLKSEFVRKA